MDEVILAYSAGPSLLPPDGRPDLSIHMGVFSLDFFVHRCVQGVPAKLALCTFQITPYSTGLNGTVKDNQIRTHVSQETVPFCFGGQVRESGVDSTDYKAR